VGILKALLRAYSCIFEGLLALFALGISLVALGSHSPLNLTFLPWTGEKLTHVLLPLALAGLLLTLLAMGGKLRALFFLWSVAVFAVLFRGFFLAGYKFSGPVPFKPAAYLTTGAFLAMIGAFPWPRKPGPVRRPQKW
jgi:hypothetical protein